MKTIYYTKMQSIWNDFIILNKEELNEKNIELSDNFIKKICDRNFWIWSNGLLCIIKWKNTDFEYIMYNSNGLEIDISWSSLICYMKYIFFNGLSIKKNISIKAKMWIVNLSIENDMVTVDIWKPSKIKNFLYNTKKLWDRFPIIINNNEFIFTPIYILNSHAVIFLRDINIYWTKIEDIELKMYWKLIENRIDIFPEKTNVDFAYIRSSQEIDMRVWEKWIWETLACWTWACASVVVGILQWKLEKNKFIKVNLKWGFLEIKWSWDINNSVIMKWCAALVSDGVYFF